MVNTTIISMGAQLTRSSTRHLKEIKDLTKHGHSFLLVLEVHCVRQLLKLERHNRHKLQQNNAMIAAWTKSPLLWARLLLHKICGPPLSARSRVPEVGILSTTTTAYHVLVEENGRFGCFRFKFSNADAGAWNSVLGFGIIFYSKIMHKGTKLW